MRLKMVTVFLLLTRAFALSAPTRLTLKDAYRGKFVIGAAISEAQITGRDAQGARLVAEQFNSISPENALKWESVHPLPGVYSFDTADRYVAFGQSHKMFIVGHTLVWHNQVPNWVFRDSKGNLVDRETLLQRMHDHIRTVVGRYKGRIQSWDVVNEVVNADGSLRQSLWLKIIGKDYIAKAFQYAHEADPAAQLAYNEYSLENSAKRRGALQLVRELRSEGVPITTVGLQGHLSLSWPSIEEEDATVQAFADLGVKVAISELDIDVLPRAEQNNGADVSLRVKQDPALNPYTAGLPEATQRQLAGRYEELFRVYLKHKDSINRVTFWGVTDRHSWLNNWPIPERTSYPLLFDRNAQPKPAFDSVIRVAAESLN